MVAERIENEFVAVQSGGYRLLPAPLFDGTQPCATTDPEVFFHPTNTRPARRLCQQCPFTVACHEYALPRPWLGGIWAGRSKAQRTRERLERGIAAIPPEWT